jgi:hypothetical protein
MLTKILNKLKFRINRLLKKRFLIPSYEEKRQVIDLHIQRYGPTIFVETGTFLGDTVEAFKDKFEFVYSIELSEELANEAIERFKDVDNIKIIRGNSGEVLSHLVPTINKKILFWLDGHYSSEFYVGDRFIATAKGTKETPILEELDVILNSSIQHIILIDDARLFNGKADYPTLNCVKRKVSTSRNSYTFFVDKDIIHIVPLKE